MKLLFVLCLLLSGCASYQPTYHYTNVPGNEGKPKIIYAWIDQHFDTFDKIAITEAICYWNKALNSYVEIVPVNYYIAQPGRPEMPRLIDWVIVKVDSTSFMASAGLPANHYVLGRVNGIGGNNLYIMRDQLEISDVYYVALHEIGHLLGAEHHGKLLSSPFFSKNRYHCIDFGTMKQISITQNIPLYNMNYCSYY